MRSAAVALLLALALPLAAPAETPASVLDEVQRATHAWFRELAHPVSGMAPERTSTPEVVTTGGTGFGILSTLVAVERGFEPREEGLARILRTARFLDQADRFHGAWPHWLDGATGEVRPFSPRDDGADLVETAFLLQGLLAAREYFSDQSAASRELGERVDRFLEEVEWTWFTRGEDVLYWHWSPRHGFAMDLPIRGWNEALVVYVLAAGSPSHPIRPAAYHRGWARGGAMKNGRRYYGVELPLGPPYGGPLFLAHYSFLGLDPYRLRDRYADYARQVEAHTRVNWAHCLTDPGGHGYSARLWGLTSSDTPGGYAAHSPTEDRGVLTPTAALGSFPYTPALSRGALDAFLRFDGGRLLGPRGFVDAFRPATGWVAEDQLAIDQGPVVAALENHRSGMLWDLFMGSPEVERGLARLGFTVAEPRPLGAPERSGDP